MTRENILHRIKKLKALADDKANVNEAANAAAMAQKLIEKHRIEEAELFELTDEEEQEEVGEENLETFNGTNLVRWRLDLANRVSYHNNCKIISYKGNRRSGKPAKITIVGRPNDVATVRPVPVSDPGHRTSLQAPSPAWGREELVQLFSGGSGSCHRSEDERGQSCRSRWRVHAGPGARGQRDERGRCDDERVGRGEGPQIHALR